MSDWPRASVEWRRGLRLRTRLLVSHLVVAATGSATVFLAVGLLAPGAFDAAMGHSMGGAMDGMSEMMGGLARAAFGEAVSSALVVAFAAAAAVGLVASLVLSSRISGPIARTAAASRRIALGRYSERVPVDSYDEIGELAESFNQMAGSLESTELRRLELVGDVAHELRTPLATLDGYLEGLEDGVVPPSEATWMLLRGETSRLSRLVNDLQELWRAQSRQLSLSMSEVDAGDRVRAARERFLAQAQQRGVEIRTELGPGHLMVRVDAGRLAQILDNLVSNAIRHSPVGGVVTLSAARTADAVTVTVADQGPGLTDDELERVFERFYRVDPSRSRALGGSGIGLSIARALAEAMGGSVRAESPGPGHGATFRLALPPA